MLSKRAKRLSVIGLLLLAVISGWFVKACREVIPVGNELIEKFTGGPNMKEVTATRTETEELLYQRVKNNRKIKKMYFLDVTADGVNELLAIEQIVYKKSNAYRVSFWGVDEEENVSSIASWTLAYKMGSSRVALYLHPEEDGSYSILEDNSVIQIGNREAEVQFRLIQFTLTEEGYAQNRIINEKGRTSEKLDEFKILSELRSESILLYDTLPEEMLLNISEEVQANDESVSVDSVEGLVRIYDVIPQGWEYTDTTTQETVNQLQESIWSSEETMKEKAAKELNGMEDAVFERHMMRVGPFQGIGDPLETGGTIPYANQIDQIEKITGYEIEYIVLNNWNDLRAEVSASKGDGVTKLVIFNNTYDESLIKELQSDQYAELSEVLEDFNFYSEEKYEQEVLYAGIVDGRQVAVPLLYNVSGMIQGEALQMNSNGEILYQPNSIEGERIGYQAFIEKLIVQMQQDEGSNMVDFISASMEENVEPALFLTASGAAWEDYENQEELFEMLLQYYRIFEDTQMDEAGLTLQYRWGYYWNQIANKQIVNPRESLSNEMMIDLKLASLEREVYGDTVAYGKLGHALLDSVKYIVENSTVEEISYHSMAGMLDAEGYYLNGSWIVGGGSMGYWPVSTLSDENSYAAQPNNYVAVIAEDGSLEQAIRVIEAMLSQETDIYHGFSLSNEVREKQLQNWENSAQSAKAGIRMITKDNQTEKYREEITMPFWSSVDQGIGLDISTKAPYVQLLRSQLDNVGFAQIADREVLSIWQKTVAETAKSNLSAEAGFELLCQRMDELYEQK